LKEKIKRSKIIEINELHLIDTTMVFLKGTIEILPDNIPIPSAEIELTSGNKTYKSISNKTGQFAFNSIPNGKYIIKANYIGCYDLKDSIDLGSHNNFFIKIGLVYDE